MFDIDNEFKNFLTSVKNFSLDDVRNSGQVKFIIGLRDALTGPLFTKEQAGDLAVTIKCSGNIPDHLVQDTVDAFAYMIITMAEVCRENDLSHANLLTLVGQMSLTYGG